MTHDEWQQAVRDLAAATGWEALHVRRSIGKGRRWTTTTSVVGWPDLWCWNPRRGGFAGIELKVPPDLPTRQQLNTLRSLAAAGARTCVAYPDDLDRLATMLSSPTGTGWEYVGRVRPTVPTSR